MQSTTHARRHSLQHDLPSRANKWHYGIVRPLLSLTHTQTVKHGKTDRLPSTFDGHDTLVFNRCASLVSILLEVRIALCVVCRALALGHVYCWHRSCAMNGSLEWG